MSLVETSMIFKTRSIQLTLSRYKIHLSVQCWLACLPVRAIFSVVLATGEPMVIAGYIWSVIAGVYSSTLMDHSTLQASVPQALITREDQDNRELYRNTLPHRPLTGWQVCYPFLRMTPNFQTFHFHLLIIPESITCREPMDTELVTTYIVQ
jgi:hypothetical protein